MNYLKHTLVTVVAGFLFYIIGERIYNDLITDGNAIIYLPLYFLVFMIIESIVLFFLSLFTGKYERSKAKKKDSGIIIRHIIIFIIVLVPISALLEYIYELGGEYKPLDATSYIFVIDDSGSMENSDPNNARKTSIQSIMNELNNDLPFAVYLFSDNCWNVKDMSNDAVQDFDLYSSGGTNIKGALDKVVDDYILNSSLWGESPKVILLSDGYPSPNKRISSTIKKIRKNGLVVSTVGYGDADELYLRGIANITGGAYVNSNDISLLHESMKEALLSYSEGKRNLLSDRISSNEALYTVLRIIFLIIVSVFIALIKANATFDSDLMVLYFGFSLVLGILASVLMEVLISHFYISTRSVHLICCLLWAILPAEIKSEKKKKLKYTPIDFDGEFNDESDDKITNRVNQHPEDEDDSFNRLGF